MDRHAARIEKLKALSEHAWYGRLVRKLSEHEYDLVVAFVDDNGHLPDPAFGALVIRLGVDKPWGSPKNEAVMADILMAVKAVT